MRIPLRQKILLYISSVLVVLIVAMLVFVSYEADRRVTERIENEIRQGRDRIKAVEQQRLRTLKTTATFFAALPNFFAALETADPPTIRDYLLDYQQRTGTELFIALNRSGQVVGSTDMPNPGALSVDPEAAVLKTPSGTYHIAMVPADSTGELRGYLIAGGLIDDKFAREELRGGGHDEVLIVSDTILGTTLQRASLPWQSQTDWEKAIGRNSDPQPVEVGGEDYLAASMELGAQGGQRPFAVVMQSQTRAMLPYRGIQVGLLILGIVAAAIGIATSAVLARTITAPLAKLAEGTEQVKEGNFDYRLQIAANDEIGDLARAFNTMIQGLRERADMQKFVSLSTVEMIQSTASKKTSAGEKKVLTIFFSDMRGFTSMSESMTPEETVKMLNACLSLQAEKVKKFHGDIDKYVGDAVLALFAGDDAELNAIRCAVEIHRALEELNAELNAKSNAGIAAGGSQRIIRVGIGIVTGEVILGSIGSDDRLDYTVIGSNVNLCSRLCSHAAPGETLLAESTYKRVHGLIAAQKAEPLHAKGFTEPVPVYKMQSS